MDKRIYVTKERVERPRREERHRNGDHDFEFRRHEFRRPPRPERDGKPSRPYFKHRHFKKVTKMFTSKESLVEYVNQAGEKGHHIDVYKIDEDLYKIVEIVDEDFHKEVEIELEEE
jgi:hypothetical protein